MQQWRYVQWFEILTGLRAEGLQGIHLAPFLRILMLLPVHQQSRTGTNMTTIYGPPIILLKGVNDVVRTSLDSALYSWANNGLMMQDQDYRKEACTQNIFHRKRVPML